MPTPFKSEDLLVINRPNKDFHGSVARFIDYGSDPSLAYVSFRPLKKGESGPQLTPPDVKTFRKRDKADIRLFPVSNLTAYAPSK